MKSWDRDLWGEDSGHLMLISPRRCSHVGSESVGWENLETRITYHHWINCCCQTGDLFTGVNPFGYNVAFV